MNSREKASLALVVALVACALVAAGVVFGQRSVQKPEIITAAPEVKQPDNSVVIERKPLPQRKAGKAPHVIPKGSTEERRIGVDVQPHEAGSAPVHIDLSLVRQDGGRRVIASSPDGDVVGALDIPIEEGVVPAEPHFWAAGVSYGPQDKSQGVWIERDLARVRVGADLIRSSDGKVAGMVRLGVTW